MTRRRLLLLAPMLGSSLFALGVACGDMATAPDSNDASLDDDTGYTGYFATDASYDDVSPVIRPGVADATAAASTVRDAAPVLERETSAPLASDAMDAMEDVGCITTLLAGSLVVDELMIESVAGTGDHGEWIEVESTLGCSVNLRGLHGECPTGAKVYTFDVTSDVWVPPNGTFLIADSSDPALNHYLPGTLVVWTGEPGDVLRSQGGTVTLLFNGLLIDSVTYPSLKPVVGASLAFPSNCLWSQLSDWTSWQTSTSSWFPGFLGTPNARNSDVSCP